MEEMLKLSKAKLGTDHPLTLANMHNLGVAYSTVKRFDQAIPLLELTLRLQEKKLGRQHLDTLSTLADLGLCYINARRLQDGIPLLEEAYQSSKKQPTLSWIGPTLCTAYITAGESAKLINLLEQRLPEARKTLPNDSLELAGLLFQFGWGLMEQERWSEAEPLLRESLTIREKTQPDAWTTFNVRSHLGRSLLGQKRYADAEPLLLSGYEGMKQREKTIPEGITSIPETVDRLIELYTATNKPDEVKKWQLERAKYPAAKK
jgi:tetratricopeptide (TPR) repeat protein